MKKYLILIALPLLLCCGSGAKSETASSASSEIVYVCTGKSSKRYHATDRCKGLRNCRGEVKAVSLSEAKSMGRTPCRYCYD